MGGLLKYVLSRWVGGWVGGVVGRGLKVRNRAFWWRGVFLFGRLQWYRKTMVLLIITYDRDLIGFFLFCFAFE